MSSHFLPDSRISARMVPKTMPPAVATTVRNRLKYRPFSRKLLTTAQLKNVRSRFMSVSSRSAGGDEARHADPLLDPGHDAVDDHRRDHVEHRDGHVHLGHAGGLLAGLHR